MYNFLLDSAENTSTSTGSYWWVYLILIVLILVMLIVPSITQRKRTKEYTNMIDNVGVGDTVRTVGGVIGRIVKINEKDGFKTIILETGARESKTTMEFDIASIGVVLKSTKQAAEQTKTEEPAPATAESAEKAETTEGTTATNLEAAVPDKTKTDSKKSASKTSKKSSKK